MLEWPLSLVTTNDHEDVFYNAGLIIFWSMVSYFRNLLVRLVSFLDYSQTVFTAMI